MAVSVIQPNEIEEYYAAPLTVVKGFKTADGTGQIQLVQAGHHPNMRVVRASVTNLVAPTDQVQAKIQDGNGNDAVTGLDSGTTAGETTEGTVIRDQVFLRNEAVMLNVTNAGTGVYALFVVQFESIHT